MRGVFIHNQLEFRLELPSEESCQGDALNCALSVKNHSHQECIAPALRLDLGLAKVSKVRQKSEKAFDIIESGVLPPSAPIGPGAQESAAWTFTLDKNCPVSDKSQSLYLIYGAASNDGAVQELPLNVQPHRYIQQILGIFESYFQFVLRGAKSSENWLNAKLKPPSSKSLSHVEELALGFHFEGEALLLRYVFKVKKLEAAGLTLGVKKEKTTGEQRLEPGKYLLTKDCVDHQAVQDAIEEAISRVARNF